MQEDISCWKESGCFRDWKDQDYHSKSDIKYDLKEMGREGHDIKDKFMWASKNWEKNLEEAVKTHQKQLDVVLENWEEEVAKIMVKEGCNE